MLSVNKLVVSIVACLLAGGLGSLFTAPAIPDWYAGLNKPWFNPPSFLFGPVWTALYILMGVALYLVWKRGMEKKEVRAAMAFFGIQLLLNSLWSVLFFGLKSPLWAFGEILVLWVMIALTMVKFAKIAKPAAWLMAPYLAWVSFAGVLNFFIFRLN